LPRFKFSLETLLRHREDIEQKEKDELFKRNYRYQSELQHRDVLNDRHRETMNEIARKRNVNADNMELTLFYLYASRLVCEIKESEKRLVALQVQVQEQKDIVIEASKKRKVLASLRSKKEKEFVTAMDKQEQKEVDELVVTRYAAKELGNAETKKN
jgi:flagellar protein FliJ